MATVERPTAAASATDAISYEDLYARWERGNWSAMAIDFTQDKIDWREKLTEEQRRGALWFYALFFHGEDAVADDLSPYVDAAPTEEQTYFLTTQQVDEARHAIFFHRFMKEVVGVEGASVGETLAATEAQLTWGHRETFGQLAKMAQALRADPGKLQLARAVTLYHVVVEATLAQSGQHIIEDYLERLDILPGFREGLGHVAQDEQRHIGFGVKLLADLHRELGDPVAEAIAGVIRDSAVWTADVAMPPGGDRRYTECFGFTVEELGEAATRSQEQKLRAIGLPLERLRLPYDFSESPKERAIKGIRMLEAGYIGPGGRAVDHAPASVALLFEAMAFSADPAAVPSGTTIAWDFTDRDVAPWSITLVDGATAAQPGPATAADLTLRISLDDFVALTQEQVSPLRLLATRRLRLKGDLRLVPKLAKVFG